MADDDLLRLSSDVESLAPEAQNALRLELERRHLTSQEVLAQFREEEKKHIAETSFDVSNQLLYGFGKRLYGKANLETRGLETEYDTTLFGLVCYFPLVPLGTFRMCRDQSSNQVRVLEKKPLLWSQVWFTWLKAVVIAAAIITAIVWLMNNVWWHFYSPSASFLPIKFAPYTVKTSSLPRHFRPMY